MRGAKQKCQLRRNFRQRRFPLSGTAPLEQAQEGRLQLCVSLEGWRECQRTYSGHEVAGSLALLLLTLS